MINSLLSITNSYVCIYYNTNKNKNYVIISNWSRRHLHRPTNICFNIYQSTNHLFSLNKVWGINEIPGVWCSPKVYLKAEFNTIPGADM